MEDEAVGTEECVGRPAGVVHAARFGIGGGKQQLNFIQPGRIGAGLLEGLYCLAGVTTQQKDLPCD